MHSLASVEQEKQKAFPADRTCARATDANGRADAAVLRISAERVLAVAKTLEQNKKKLFVQHFHKQKRHLVRWPLVFQEQVNSRERAERTLSAVHCANTTVQTGALLKSFGPDYPRWRQDLSGSFPSLPTVR
jgi:hypothetical protein